MKYFETYHFSKERFFGERYVRVFLGEIVLTGKFGNSFLYPLLTLYENGVILINFRRLIDTETRIDEFVENEVMFRRNDITRVLVPKPIADLNSLFTAENNLKKSKKHKNGDFIFEMTEEYFEHPTALADVALYLFTTLGRIANVFFAKKGESIEVSEYWRGRLSVHLIEFEGQANAATENHSLHYEDLTRITSHVSSAIGVKDKLGDLDDLRYFDDFNAYTSGSGFLFVWSKSGLALNERFNDINLVNLVYNNQVLSDYCAFVDMSFMAILSRIKKTDDMQEVLRLQEYYYQLQFESDSITRFGETQEMLRIAYSQFGVDKTASEIDKQIELTKTKVTHLADRTQNKVTDRITILFGIISVPVLADSVVIPVLRMLNAPIVGYENAMRVLSTVFSILIVWIVLILIRMKK